MKLTCPQCGFSREIDPKRFHSDSVIATCPKCSCRFRFSVETGVGAILPPKGWQVLKDPVQTGESEEAPGEEEDIRLVAKRAYEREAERFKNDQPENNPAADQQPAHPEIQANPWEAAPGESGWLAAFYQTVIRVMFSPQIFFRNLAAQCPQIRPLVFYLILCVVQTSVERIWGDFFHTLLAPEAAGDPQLEKILAMLSQDGNIILGLLLRCGMLVLQLYLFSFLMFLAYRLVAPGRATFSLLFQIMAYSSSPALLCVVPVLGSLVGMFWSLGCLIVGCKAALDLSWPKTLAGFLPLVFVFAPLFPEILSLIQK